VDSDESPDLYRRDPIGGALQIGRARLRVAARDIQIVVAQYFGHFS
jgi:hypothetical protein